MCEIEPRIAEWGRADSVCQRPEDTSKPEARQRGGLVAVRDELRLVFGCAGIVYAWLASVHASLRAREAAYVTNCSLALTD